jgi:hypothetical protein
MAKAFYAGLDLGQTSDYSALVVVEKREGVSYDPAEVQMIAQDRVEIPDWEAFGTVIMRGTRERHVYPKLWRDGAYVDPPAPELLSYDVRHIKRWALGTPYPQIVRETVDLLRQPPLAEDTTLVIDGTGVGRPVVDLFTEAPGATFPTVPVVITAGNNVTFDEGYWHCPKRDLVACVQVALQNKQLRYPEANKMRWVKELTHELGAFKYKITQAGNDTYGAWRERDHDDLVLALALAVWQAERYEPVYVAWADEED